MKMGVDKRYKKGSATLTRKQAHITPNFILIFLVVRVSKVRRKIKKKSLNSEIQVKKTNLVMSKLF